MIVSLWNEVRDSVGQAALDFNERTKGLRGSGPTFSTKDCKAQGRYCIRIEKQPEGTSIEIFLDASDDSLKSSLNGDEPVRICGYRLTDRKVR